jgi:hypothetical protein
MKLSRQAPEGTLDLVDTGAARNAEEFVVVTLGRRHHI